MSNSLTERFQIGIKRYGYDSDFRRRIEEIVNSERVNVEELRKCFNEFDIN